MKFTLCTFILLLLSTLTCYSQSGSSIIEDWGIEHIISENSEILVWSEESDSAQNLKRRSILIVELLIDSSQKTSYHVMQYCSLDVEFKTWNIPVVYRHPPKDYEGEADPRHYTIRREETYDHLPTSSELEQVWNRGSYYFNLKRDFNLVFMEINKPIWKSYYLHLPTEKDFKAFR